MKKGYIVVLDAIIALVFVLIIFTAVFSTYYSKTSKTSTTSFKNLHYLSEDILDVMNKQGILDQIGSEWAESNGSTNSTHWINASNISGGYLESLVPRNIGYRMTIDDDIISENLNRISENSATAKTHSSRLLVGYGKGLPTMGQTARTFLTKIMEKKTSAYVYFGGFEGQGNLTKILTLPYSLDKVQQAYIEVDSGGEFKLYVNGNLVGTFTASEENMSANIKSYVSNPETYFNSGDNEIRLKFTSNDLSNQYIGGGFIKVTYNTSEMDTSQQSTTSYYYFPGIDGLINLYSSFYVPGTLNSMEIHLKFLSNYSTYLTIGNVRVFNSTSGNYTNKTADLDNAYLGSVLNYNSLSLKTIPIRIGIENVSYVTNATGNADVILITDLSSSMNWKLDSNSDGVTRDCTHPQLYNPTTKRISLAKCLANEFVDIILNTTGNRIGLLGYSGIPNGIPTASSTIVQSYHDLSTNNLSLKTQINGYWANGATGICGGIRQARNMLETQGNASRQKFIIVMTDGLANVQCSPSDEDSTIGCIPGTCPTTTFCAGGGCLYQQCGDYVSDRARDDAINAACDANDDLNITVYSIGFGPVSSCSLSNQTLNSIASCGNGSYYASSNATELKNIYSNIAQQITGMSYKAQTAAVTGSIKRSILYPESYIKFTYSPVPLNISIFGGITLTQDTERFNNVENCTGNIFVTESARVSDALITSYSAEHWTDKLYVEGSPEYMLSDYGNNYNSLGDPFAVQIPNPVDNLIPDKNNSIMIKTGNSPSEDTGCSPDNRAIYTIRLDGRVGYGGVFPEKNGCNWTIQFEDNTYLSAKIPGAYNGTKTCSYTENNVTYSTSDAIDDAIFRLLKKLDSNNNNKMDIKFDSDMIEFDFSRSGGVKSLWGPIIIKLILWM